MQLTYPNGRVLRYEYTAGTNHAGLDDRISRLSYLADDDEGDVGTHLEEYSYLGLATTVRRARPQPDVDLTYIKQGSESDGDAGDQYTGLDRFARVVDQRWRATSDGSHTDRFQYGYDKNSNRLYRANLVNDDFDELYHENGSGNGYDGFNQLVAFSRGTLNSGKDTISSPVHTQEWELDSLGNWVSLTDDGTPIDREHNKQNQLTEVDGNDLSFDDNGNTTVDETGKQYVYDAWNRLVKVKNSGGTLLVSYSYDAFGRRLTESINGGTTRDLYYSDQWQVLEDKVSSGSGTAQYVWGRDYVDALVLRDRDTNGDSTLDERLYVQQDANWNVTAVVSTAGVVLERYVYDPYGRFTDAEGDDTATLEADWDERGASQYGWIYFHQGGRYDGTSGLYHFRNRDYSPTLGRWMRVDPLGYGAGDPNLYRATGNNPIAGVDPVGEDFITVADRPVNWVPGARHYSLIYWKFCGDAPDELKQEPQTKQWVINQGAKKNGGMELQTSAGWFAWKKSGLFGKKVVPVTISYIVYSESGEVMQALELGNQDPQQVWAQMLAEATNYKYAEQGIPKPPKVPFKHWPWSYYELAIGDMKDVAVNSNTFVRHIVNTVAPPMKELPGKHPGAMKAEDKYYFGFFFPHLPPFKPGFVKP